MMKGIMMSNGARFVLVAALCCVGHAGVGSPVLTAHFEGDTGEAPTGWRFVAQRGRCSGRWDTLDGSRCLRMQIADDVTARATWSYGPKLPLKPSTPYRLSVRILVAEATDESKVYVIGYENGIEAPSHWHLTPYLNGTQDWRTYAIRFRTRPDTTWMRLQCKLWYGTGYAWFDDVVIEELPADTDVETPPGQLPPPEDDGTPLQVMWYPAQRRTDETVCLLGDSFNPVAFFPFGDRAEIRDPHLILDLPRGIRVMGSVVAGRSPMPPAVDIQPAEITRGGTGRLRWRLPIPAGALRPNMRPDGPHWTGYHFVYVEPQPNCPQTFDWRWRLESGGQLGPVHSIPGRVFEKRDDSLEPLEHFPLYAQHTGALRYPAAEGRNRILKHLSYAGISGGLSLTHYQPEYADVDEELARQGFRLWAWRFEGYSRLGVEGRDCVPANPETFKRKCLCPSAQLDRVEPWWQNLCDYYRRRLSSGLKTLIIDYEPPVFNVCFCEHCRRRFARFTGLAEDKILAMSPADIQALPEHAWGRFRAQQNATIVKHHIKAIHDVNPEVTVGLCCSPYTEWSVNRGMDIKQFEPEVGFHAPMIYRVGTRYEACVRSTCAGTAAPVLPFLLASDMVVRDPFPMPADVRINMLVTALSGGRGAILWVGIESLDGEYLNALRQSLQEIHLFQPYILAGTRVPAAVNPHAGKSRTITVDGREIEVSDSNTLTPIRSWAWETSESVLTAAVNYDTENEHRIRIDGAANAAPLLGPAPAAFGADAVLTLPPHAVSVLLQRRKPPAKK